MWEMSDRKKCSFSKAKQSLQREASLAWSFQKEDSEKTFPYQYYTRRRLHQSFAKKKWGLISRAAQLWQDKLQISIVPLFR